MPKSPIVLRGVNVHNLKNVDLELAPNQLTVFCGVSGSGKSSLAFDTLYIEGQRRYIESLSAQAKQQMGSFPKPDLLEASGVTPTISIEQKVRNQNPRSTVGTLTEIYDYLRVLFARIGQARCPISLEHVSPLNKERIVAMILSEHLNERVTLLAPLVKDRKGEFREDLEDFLRKGFMRARINGKVTRLDELPTMNKRKSHTIELVIDRFEVTKEEEIRLIEGVKNGLEIGKGVLMLWNMDQNQERLFSLSAFSQKSGLSYAPLEPHDFSFNTPQGMCSECMGLGEMEQFDLDLILDPDKSIAQGCCAVGGGYNTVRFGNIYRQLARTYRFKVTTPWKELSKAAQNVFLYGVDDRWLKVHFTHPETGKKWTDHVEWRGVIYEAMQRYHEAKSSLYRKAMQKLMRKQECPSCKGSRLKPYPCACTLGGTTLHELTEMTIEEVGTFFKSLHLTPTDQLIGEELLREIKKRLEFLIYVGLGYLTLGRTSPTLSGGEAQRVRLAGQIGSGLVGVTYVLDEPSIGLHPRDNHLLIETLYRIRDRGNHVIVVEHDEEMLLSADHIVEVGPGPGKRGGQIVFQGSVEQILEDNHSLTGQYLCGKQSIPIPKRRGLGKEFLEIRGCRHHNLKNVDLKIPLGRFVAITGVSGSGKSSLILETLYPLLENRLHRAEKPVGAFDRVDGIEHVDKVIGIDQSPIGRNPRSNPATYIKLFDLIRDLFAQLPLSVAKGLGKSHFSFNIKEGSCTTCQGSGCMRVDMDFLEDAFVPCPTCHGKRFDPITLSSTYKGKSIHDVLEMEVGEALLFFGNYPKIKHGLEVLCQVGLDYLHLGQPSTTLSGGEAQRIKLAKELLRPSTGKTVYILDEPTTGLHFGDIQKLLNVLHQFANDGNTVLVIEHNMDVVKTADWIIDVGPDAGALGGEIVGQNTPEKIAKADTPTGVAVRTALDITKNRTHYLQAFLNKPPRVHDVSSQQTQITIQDATQNNLKGVCVNIPRDQITLFTGPSGSGKSSLAFDTLFAESQRRYAESMPAYARQFIQIPNKPQVEQIEGVSPSISIEQKVHAGNPRSTIGTITECYDYLRILYAHVGIPYNPKTGHTLERVEPEYLTKNILRDHEGKKLCLLAPLHLKTFDASQDAIQETLLSQGYLRAFLGHTFYDLEQDTLPLDELGSHPLYVVIDRIRGKQEHHERLLDSIQRAIEIGKDHIALFVDEKLHDIHVNLTDRSTGESFPPLTPKTFSFNTPHGYCPYCQGIGTQFGSHILSDPNLMYGTVRNLFGLLMCNRITHPALEMLDTILNQKEILWSDKIFELSTEQLQYLSRGSPDPIELSDGITITWRGIDTVLAYYAKHHQGNLKKILEPLMTTQTCAACHGSRLHAFASHVQLQGVTLPDLLKQPIDKAKQHLASVVCHSQALEDVQKSLIQRLHFLEEIGVGYLSLDRTAPTLSGGEMQRIRLARQLGSGLTGALYVLDEPTIGLHPKDTHRLNQALLHLKNLGNTLVVVEHEPSTISIADYLVDFGPGSGKCGGTITAQGTPQALLENPESLTGQYLSGKKHIPQPQHRRTTNETLSLRDASKYTIEHLDLDIHLKAFTCITGVSGSGKSTLVHQILSPLLSNKLYNTHIPSTLGKISGYESITNIIELTQDPIGLSSRSDVGTYSDIIPAIRVIYSELPQAQAQYLYPGCFSYNHREGMCLECQGLGYKKIDLLFLPSVKVTCPMCNGHKINAQANAIEWKGICFGQLLKLSIDQLIPLFENQPYILPALELLQQVGLGYLSLGQEMTTLSGGEAQRIKLSRELAKRSKGHTFYILDEPTVGLHPDDIAKLLPVIHSLVNRGHTVLAVEHQTDFIANADYLIEMGPEAGANGGKILAQGPTHEVLNDPNSQISPYISAHKSTAAANAPCA